MKNYLLSFLVALTLGVTAFSFRTNTDILHDVAVVNGDQLFLFMKDGSKILVELEDEDNVYDFAYKGEEYRLYYVNVCEKPVGDVQECQSYVMFNERNYHAEHLD